MKLSELLKGIDVLNQYDDLEITNVTSDSRKIQKGCLFVCIKGAAFDGHTAAAEAIKNGAAAVVAERAVDVESAVMVTNTRRAYALICSNYFKNPSSKLKLIGVTGTNGKTTTTFLIRGILEQLGKKTGLIGTVQNMIGDRIVPAHYTTPEPYELNKLFSDMVEESCEYCVMEVSSQALAQGRVDGCVFDIAVFTNLTQEHLDYHKTMENYLAAKHILFENSKIAIVNCDDSYAESIVAGTNCKVLTYSAEKDEADFTAKNIKLSSDGVQFELVNCENIGRITLHIPGRFSIYNAMAAASAVVVAGMPFEDVVECFSKLSGVKGRVEVVPINAGFTVVIDYAHTPDALENVIKTLKEVSKGRVVTVFGCGGDRDKTKRPVMGRIAAEYSDFVVVTSDNPRTEDPSAIIDDILVGMRNTETPYEVVENRAEAIEYAMKNAKEGDVVLLAGKGHETYQILSTETIHFDEREVVARVAAQMGLQ